MPTDILRVLLGQVCDSTCRGLLRPDRRRVPPPGATEGSVLAGPARGSTPLAVNHPKGDDQVAVNVAWPTAPIDTGSGRRETLREQLHPRDRGGSPVSNPALTRNGDAVPAVSPNARPAPLLPLPSWSAGRSPVAGRSLPDARSPSCRAGKAHPDGIPQQPCRCSVPRCRGRARPVPAGTAPPRRRPPSRRPRLPARSGPTTPPPAGWPGSSSTATIWRPSFGGTSFPDQGLTIDAVFAFAAARVVRLDRGRGRPLAGAAGQHHRLHRRRRHRVVRRPDRQADAGRRGRRARTRARSAG